MTIPSTTSTTGTGDSSTTTRTAKKELGQEDFLQLLTVQLSKQDPMKPMDDTAFIAQMAQFSALSQTSALVAEMGYLRADAQMQAASSLIGRQVTVSLDDGSTVTGLVDSVEADSSTVYVNLDGTNYEFGRVVRVEPAPVADPSTETN